MSMFLRLGNAGWYWVSKGSIFLRAFLFLYSSAYFLSAKFIPTPVTKENLIRRQLLAAFNQFVRRMRLQYIFHGEENEPHSFHVNWEPPVLLSVALETFLEEVKLELASIEFDKPKDNISTGERQALKELSRNKSVILKKSDKGNTTVLMSRQDKLNEGQVLLNDSNNYRPLDKTRVETTTKKAQQLIKTVLPEGHIAKTAAKWLSLIRLILRKSTKLELASVEFDKPKDNISTGECQALKEFSRNKSIILKKSE